MQPFEIISELGSELEMLTYLPENVICHLLPYDELYYVYGFWGYIVFQVLHLIGVDLWDSQYYLNCAVRLSGSSNNAFIEQHNSVDNYFVSDWDGIIQPAERQGQGGFSVGPYINNNVQFPGAGVYRTTDFHYAKENLASYANAYPSLDNLLTKFENRQFHRAQGYAELKGEPRLLLNSLYNPYCKKEIQAAYQNLKAEEYLINILEQLDSKELPANMVLSPTLEEKARYVEQLLNEQYMEPVTLKMLSRIVGTNAEYLRRAFKARTGKTIIEYLTLVRVNKVKEFLRDTTLTLEGIADETGFCNGDRLGKVFKQYTGMTPMTFRGYRGKPEE